MTNLLLYQRIAQQLAEDIRRGVYQPGERVPSVRKLSTQLNVSHATVLQAYVPNWSTEPVTAICWVIGCCDRALINAHSSASEALSPSTSP